MIIGDRLRTLREGKKFSQGDIEKKTGLLRCYVSRVENGHTVPSVETLEKFARALEVPMYQLFYDGEEPPKLPNLPKRKSADDVAWGSRDKDAHLLAQFCRLFSRLEDNDLVTHRVTHQITNAMYLQLPHDVGAVCFYSFNADTQRGSDFFIPLALRKELNNFPLA